MPKQTAEAVRPGSIFRAWDTSWKVLENDTLSRRMTLAEVDNPSHRKLITYHPGQEIFVRWAPFNSRS